LTRLINPESLVELQDHLTFEDASMPSEEALAEGVIQLCAQKLKKVVVADELQIAPREVTDSKLAVLCDSIRDDPTDILVLCGCHFVTNISCLVQLSTISHLDISRCNLGTKGAFHLAGVIKDMGALCKLILKDNHLATAKAGEALGEALKGNTVLKELDVSGNYWDLTTYGGDKGDSPGFAKGISKGLAGNGALTSVDISNQKDSRGEGGIGAEGAKYLAEALKDHA
jgi:hypothetical protein